MRAPLVDRKVPSVCKLTQGAEFKDMTVKYFLPIFSIINDIRKNEIINLAPVNDIMIFEIINFAPVNVRTLGLTGRFLLSVS